MAHKSPVDNFTYLTHSTRGSSLAAKFASRTNSTQRRNQVGFERGDLKQRVSRERKYGLSM
jgi:hypothetical protein